MISGTFKHIKFREISKQSLSDPVTRVVSSKHISKANVCLNIILITVLILCCNKTHIKDEAHLQLRSKDDGTAIYKRANLTLKHDSI